MIKKQQEELNEIIRNGRLNYVLTYGSRYALFMFVSFWFFTKVIFEEEFYVGVNLIIWGIAGLIVGLVEWNNLNKNPEEKLSK